MRIGKLTKPRLKVVVLVGLPASGKSYYAKKLTKEAFIIVNQDTLKSRGACIGLAKLSLSKGLNVVIDRCNTTRKQRSFWIKLAKQYKATLECVVFEPHVDLSCINAEKRKDHPNFPNKPNEIETIVRKFYANYEEPTYEEGFDAITSRLTYHSLSHYLPGFNS